MDISTDIGGEPTVAGPDDYRNPVIGTISVGCVPNW
jgi:hypothetical protein